MLNKGPYVVDAVRALDSILQRMQTHQEKKRATLRSLGIARHFFEGNGEPVSPAGRRQGLPRTDPA